MTYERQRPEDEETLAEPSELDATAAEIPTPTGTPPSPQPAAPAVVADTLVGRAVGAYRLTGVIGDGGMGRVYRAQQEKPRRTVALKLMKPGIVSPATLRRFEFESQILGRLRHPGIAQVYEAGTFDDEHGAVPYFAMEYIPNAREMIEWADERRLDRRSRIELFMTVCDAVHHGHQKGIIHRDLKPGNILVDASGRPRIIDFGVARSTDSDMNAATLQTSVGQLVGTLQYMSPEQCEADPDDIDTRSDVYALGVVLYELLCGELPYDLSGTALHEATRIIRERPPVRPSTVARNLRGDLETILLMALEKDRERRYPSTQALGEDLRRFLDHEPIVARPPSLPYQVRMLARRHRAATAAIAAVGLLLAVGVPVLVMARAEARIAEAERDAAAALAESEQNQRIEEVHGLVGLLAHIDEDLRHLSDSEAIRAGLLDRVFGRLDQLAGQTDRHPLVLEQLAMAHERRAQVPLPPGSGRDAALVARLAAWDEVLSLHGELLGLDEDGSKARYNLTNSHDGRAGFCLALGGDESLNAARRLHLLRTAQASLQWCRDEGDSAVRAAAPAPFRELMAEEIADCERRIEMLERRIRRGGG